MTLSEYLTAYLGDIVTDLNISASAISFAVDESISAYGVDTEADATDLDKLHKLAKVEMWKRIMLLNSANFDVSSDGNSYKSSQIFDFAKQNYLNALSDASEYLDAYTVEVDSHRLGGRHHAEF